MPYKNKKDLYESQARHREKNKRLVREFLRNHPCVDCGENDIIVLQFDHVRGVKKFTIGHALSGSTRSWKALQSEIEKCEVRCANCHIRRHAIENNNHKCLPS